MDYTLVFNIRKNKKMLTLSIETGIAIHKFLTSLRFILSDFYVLVMGKQGDVSAYTCLVFKVF